MPHPIVMPSFGMYTAEGTLLAWLCPAGSHVEAGQPVLAIETEKATHEVPAPTSGILHPVAEVGALLKEQSVAGYILAPDEAPPQQSPPAPARAPGDAARSSTAARESAVETSGIVKASPLARKLALEHGLDLGAITGTGPGGRIGEADVLAAIERRETARTPTTSQGQVRQWRIRARTPLSGMRRTIAERLRRSLNTSVPLTLTREVEAERLVSARHSLSEAFGMSVPFDAFFVKFLARGLRDCPSFNAVIQENDLLILDEVNIGVAVSVPRGLVVPVIRDADVTPLTAVSRQIRDFSDRARAGTLKSVDLEAGTATVTNLGEYGIDAFTPVLNPPQSTILGVGRIRPRAVVRDGALAPAHTCVLSLTFDHRVEDGAPAARLLEVIAGLMNDQAFLDGLAS